MAAPAATEAAITRALAAAKAAGLRVVGYSVTRDGTIDVRTAEQVDSAPAPVARLPRQWGAR